LTVTHNILAISTRIIICITYESFINRIQYERINAFVFNGVIITGVRIQRTTLLTFRNIQVVPVITCLQEFRACIICCVTSLVCALELNFMVLVV
jgi:hypothetical protein